MPGKDSGEALTGEHTGGVSSRETRCEQGADAVVASGRQNIRARKGERSSGPARSQTSSTCGSSMRENREIPCPPTAQKAAGRAGKVIDQPPAMHGQGKSDRPVVPTKLSNNPQPAAAEATEGI